MSIPIEIWRWLTTPEGLDAIARAPSDRSPAAIARLRKKLDADQVRGVLEAADARDRAHYKLDPDWASRLIADRAGVEMASSAQSSMHKAARYARVLGEGGRVADLCCGIGADAWGLSRCGLDVTGVDLDESRAIMFAHNLPGCKVIHGDAFEASPSFVDAFHLDPARRSDAERTRTIDDFQPGPEVWNQIIDKVGTGAIKLNPGVDACALPDGVVEILSESGTLTQAILWIGKLAGAHPRCATLLTQSGSVSIVGEPDRPDDSHEIGAFIGTLDPCVERADLVGTLLDDLGVSLVHPGTGLVTTDSLSDHPMVRWYRTLDVLPWNQKRVRSALRSLDAGIVEIRTRAGVVNPDETQRSLRGDGNRNDLSVLIYRLGDRVVSVIAEQVQTKAPAGSVVPTGSDGGCDDG